MQVPGQFVTDSIVTPALQSPRAAPPIAIPSSAQNNLLWAARPRGYTYKVSERGYFQNALRGPQGSAAS